MATTIELETERLLLRGWRMDDYDAFARLNADPQVMACFPSLLNRSDSNAMADRIRALMAERGWGFWAVELKGGAPFIGFTGLNVPTTALPFSPCVEIGWRLAAEFWGRGYASEAGHAALHAAFDHLQLPEIISFTAVGNRRSVRVMERLGMEESGCFEHPDVAPDSPLRDHILYRLSRERWRTHALHGPACRPSIREVIAAGPDDDNLS
jgi:RimJ/RimL family protein N-acetyltransferase